VPTSAETSAPVDSFATTERYYLQARMEEASRRLQHDLLDLRRDSTRTNEV